MVNVSCEGTIEVFGRIRPQAWLRARADLRPCSDVQASFLGRQSSMAKRGGGGSNHGGAASRSFVFRAEDSNSMALDADTDPESMVCILSQTAAP